MSEVTYDRAEFDAVMPEGECGGVGLRAGAIITRGSDVLLLELPCSGPIRQTLKLPGATVFPGESVTGALIRGVGAETGLEVTEVGDFVGGFDYLSPAGKRVRRLHFAVAVAETEPVVLSEHAKYHWVPLGSRARVTPSIRRILDTYRESLAR
ncbi:MAG: NUDIX hydrolase [Nocardia sp.]|nr:NUDIX hydrolase [Nocardia sp.]